MHTNPLRRGQRLRCDSAQQVCYTERTTAQSTVRVRLCGWQGVGRFGRAKQERPAPTCCSDITSSLQPRRAATHALTFVFYRLRTSGIIVYLVNTVLAMGDKVIGVRLE